MKQFEVTITETLIKKIIIATETVEEAENIADSMNFNGEIDWSSDVSEDGDTVVREVKPVFYYSYGNEERLNSGGCITFKYAKLLNSKKF